MHSATLKKSAYLHLSTKFLLAAHLSSTIASVYFSKSYDTEEELREPALQVDSTPCSFGFDSSSGKAPSALSTTCITP